jgi:hypothetical protein
MQAVSNPFQDTDRKSLRHKVLVNACMHLLCIRTHMIVQTMIRARGNTYVLQDA